VDRFTGIYVAGIMAKRVQSLREYKRDDRGNVAMMFGFLILGTITAAGLAIDGTRMMRTQHNLTMIADDAAIAGAFAAENDKDRRKAITEEFVKANAYQVMPSTLGDNYIIEFNDDAKELRVELTANTNLFFGNLIGKKTVQVRAESTTSFATAKIDPVSIAFALDVSGSMDWVSTNGQKKIEVLKTSTGLLFDAVEAGTDRPDLLEDAIRSGMSAYNTEIVSDRNMDWGWTHLEASVDNLIAEGGTNSTPALLNSYQQLLDDRNFRKSDDPEFDISTLNEYVLFMTDGDNNELIWDEESQQVCRDMRADGIEIYSVAFTAPEKGELLLLDCASYNDGSLDGGEEPSGNGNNGNGGDPSKCNNNGSKGKGKALGHCKKDPGPGGPTTRDKKSNYFFDADNAADFKAAFEAIGYKISKSDIRIKS